MNSANFAFTPAMAILAITVALSLIGFSNVGFLRRGLFRPYWFLRRKQFDTLFLSGLLHADLAHLFFNMFTFFFFAFPLERQMGGAMFVVLYVVAMAAGNAWTYLKQRNNPDYATLGASGAVSAVLFASIVFNPHMGVSILLLPISIPGPLFAVLYLAYTYYAAKHPHGSINHDAHMGGALLGLVFVAVVEPDAYRGFLDAWL